MIKINQGGDIMFENISFVTYGRCTKKQNWYLDNISGVSRIYYIHSGSVLYSNGKEKHTLKPGMAYIFPQNLPFQLITDNNTNIDHTFFDFFSSPALIMNTFTEINPEKNQLIKSALAPILCLANNYPFSSAPTESIYHSLTKNYLASFLNVVSNEINLSFLKNDIIDEAVAFIHQNFKTQISVNSLALKYNLEKNVFIRKFKKHTGITPYSYIKNLRLNFALSLIMDSSYSLSEIAEKSGYGDSVSLSHAVKKAYGNYPKQLKGL